jgi:hypothetical protein
VAWGLGYLFAPERVMRDLGHAGPDRQTLTVIRILGARHVAQGVVSVLFPSAWVLTIGAGVDGLHAASLR